MTSKKSIQKEFRSPEKTADIHVPRKVILIGDASVGKTSLLRRFIANEFDHKIQSTIGVDFRVHRLDIGSYKYKIQFWDAAGQERFHSMTQSFYRASDAVMLVFDVYCKLSFKNVEKWYGQLRQYFPDTVKGVLIGNKLDLGGKEVRQVSSKEGTEMAEKLGLIYMETSAKDGTNVNETFQAILNCIHEDNVGKVFVMTKDDYTTLVNDNEEKKEENKDNSPCC